MKKASIIWIALLLAFALNGCKKLWFGKDDELSLPKQPYTGQELRTDGYYYLSFYNDGKMTVYFLFNNGIILHVGDAQEMNNLEYDIEKLKNIKFSWGIFIIENDTIKFERWHPSAPPYKAYIREGKISNDTTFIITKGYRLLNGEKTEERDLNEIYHFKAFSPKPNSTNSFIP